MLQQHHSEAAFAGGQLCRSRITSKTCFGHECILFDHGTPSGIREALSAHDRGRGQTPRFLFFGGGKVSGTCEEIEFGPLMSRVTY
jgi:hypothetical protein